jgi:hypothetical protein
VIGRARRIGAIRCEGPNNLVLGARGEGDVLQKPPEVDKLGYVLNREVFHRDVSDPSGVREGIMNRSFLALGDLKNPWSDRLQ